MIDLRTSTQFTITELFLITKIGKIDIRGCYEEINIFDSILNPCMSGNILIRDASSLTNSVVFDGSEIIFMKISKTGQDSFAIEKSFRIYKQTDRNHANQNTETYVLHFVSEEFFISSLQTVSRTYDGTYSQAISSVMDDYLKIKKEKIFYIEESKGVKKFVIPNMKPLQSILWMTKKSIDKNNIPSFLFFENIDGYNFISLSTLIKDTQKIDIFFNYKNLGESVVDNMFSVRNFQVLQQFNLLENIKYGVYAGKFIGYDIGTNSLIEVPFSFRDWYDSMPHLNSSPNIGNVVSEKGSILEQYDSRYVFSPSFFIRSVSKNVQKNNPESLTITDDTEKYAFQRKAVFSNFLNQRVKLVMSGNFIFTSGRKLYLKVPNYGSKDINKGNLDKTLFGNYLIVSTRHIIKYDRHETIIEATTDSSNKVDSNKILQYTG
jgi:hypothetical protein